MKILVNTDGFAPLGGVERSTLQVSTELVRRGHECHLLYARPEGSLRPDWERISTSMTQVPGFTVATRAPWRTAHQLPRAVRAVRPISPDVIYANRAEQLLWARAAARTADCGLVVHLRHHPVPRAALRLLRGGRTAYVAVSEFIRDEWVAAGLDPAAVSVVPNGVDPSAYPAPTECGRAAARAALQLPAEAPLVLSYGRLAPDKGIENLLDAWALMPSSTEQRSGTTSPVLLLAGDIDPSVARRLSAAPPSVVHVPRRTDVVALLHAADLVVLPASWQEPFGRVVIEAMSAGVPVVASRVGGIPEVLDGRFADQLVAPDDPTALANAITRLAGWRRTRPDLGPAGRQHVQTRFTLERTVDGVEQVLAEAADRTRPRREEVRGWSRAA